MVLRAALSLVCVLAFAKQSAALFCGPGTVLDAELGGCVAAPERSFRTSRTGPQVKTREGNLELRVDSGKDVSVLIGEDKYSLNLGGFDRRVTSVAVLRRKRQTRSFLLCKTQLRKTCS